VEVKVEEPPPAPEPEPVKEEPPAPEPEPVKEEEPEPVTEQAETVAAAAKEAGAPEEAVKAIRASVNKGDSAAAVEAVAAAAGADKAAVAAVENTMHPPGTSFEVKVVKSGALGIDLEMADQKTLGVRGLKDGCCKDSGIQAGDYIFAVNNVKDDNKDILKEIQDAKADSTLTFLVKRPKQTVVKVTKGAAGLGLDLVAQVPESLDFIPIRAIKADSPLKSCGVEVTELSRIVKVNGQGGSPSTLVKALQATGELELTISVMPQ